MYARGVVRPSVERARRVRRIEAAALGMLAILPVVPYLTFLLRTGVPRFTLLGDLAVLERVTRHVFAGDVLVGAPSASGFSQPGPLFLYLAAPFQAISAPNGTGLFVAAALVNGAAAAGVVASARLFARRAHAIAALGVVLLWFLAFGSIAASPMPAFLVVLPLLAFLYNAAMLARGKSMAAFPAMAFGTLAVQIHVAAATTVPIVTIAAVIAFLLVQRRRLRGKPSPDDPNPSHERWHLLIATGVAFFLFLPPLVDQILSPAGEGNLRKIAALFTHHDVSFGTAMREWMTMLGWLPWRVARMTLLSEGFVPVLESKDSLFIGTTPFPAILTSIHLGAGAAAALIARRRKDTASLALLGIGFLAELVCIPTLQWMPSTPALVLWTSAAGAVFWIGTFSSFFAAIGAQLLKVPAVSSSAATTLVLSALVIAVTTASLQRVAFAKHAAAIGSHPELRVMISGAYDGVLARLKRDNATPMIHADGLPDIAAAFETELENDHVRRDAKPLHLWFNVTGCADEVARSGDLVVLTGCAPL